MGDACAIPASPVIVERMRGKDMFVSQARRRLGQQPVARDARRLL
jgi:hypothetical protein